MRATGLVSGLAAAAATCFLFLAPAMAQTQQDIDRCNSVVPGRATRGSDQQVIQGCSAMLESSGLDAKNRSAALSNRSIGESDLGQNLGAMTDLNDAIALDPANSAAFANRSGMYLVWHDFDRVIADASEAIRLNPNTAEAFNNRGNAYAGKNDNSRAMADYNQAIGLKNQLAFFNRGILNIHAGNFDAAIADFTAYLQGNPGDGDGFIDRGIAHFRKGELDLAISDYNHALQLNGPGVVYDASYNRALAYLKQGRKDLARADLQNAISAYPQDTDARDLLGKLQATTQAAAPPIPNAKEMATANAAGVPKPFYPPESFGGLWASVRAKVASGDTQGTLGDADKLLAMSRQLQDVPDTVQLLAVKGAALVKLKRNADAVTAYGEAAALDPAMYVNLCLLQFQLGSLDGPVVANCNRALQASPNSADLYFIKATLAFTAAASDPGMKLDSAGKTIAPQARQALQKYLQLAPSGSHASDAREMLDNVSAN